MNKRKCSEDETDKEEEEDDEDIWDSSSIPLPIQTFLWRQTSPFIRPKISRLQDAAAMEQREACKLFEKVLVQNIQFGLSPSLTEAIHSVSRWRMIVAALPHVMHCCAALLYARRKSSFDKLSASETKLLYTLHWILLDAAEECADAETERGIHRLPEHYLLPITTIQTFVYLYAPLIPHLKQSDFLTSFRLENGYKIWIPLFHFCHPEIPSFIAHARKSKFFSSRVEKKVAAPKFGDVFIGANGEKQSKAAGELADPCDPFSSIPPPPPSRATESPAAAEGEFMSREDLKKKHEFNEKEQVEPFLATYLDVAVLRCLFTSQWIEEGIEWALHFLFRRLEAISKYREKRRETLFRSSSLPTPKRKSGERNQTESKSCRPKNTDSNNEASIGANGENTQLKTGASGFQESRRSSFSGLPGLSGFQALISSTSSASFGRHGSEKAKHKKQKKGDSAGIKVPADSGKQRSEQNIAGRHHQQQQQEFSGKHGIKGEESKGGKGKSKKDKSSVTASHKQQKQNITDERNSHEQRPNSATEFKTLYDFKNRKISLSDHTKLMDKYDQKGKSMPSLHLIDKRSGSLTSGAPLLDAFRYSTTTTTHPVIPIDSANKSPPTISVYSIAASSSSDHHHHHHNQHHHQQTVQSVPFPIITITEHSPVASKQFFNNNCDSESVSGRRELETPVASNYKFYIGDEYDHHHHQQQQHFSAGHSLTRSKTDSEINYSVETSGESLASINYVTKNGQLSLVVILKAIHSITLKDSVCSIRTCRIIFNIINKLISMKIINKHTASMYKSKKHKTFKPNVENVELSIHHLFMDSLFRIIKQLGCSRGCGEGRRESDALRLKENVMKTLKSLYDLSETHFMQYCEMLVQSHPVQEVIDILHAFLGFCSESSTSAHSSSSMATNAQHLTAFPHKKSHPEHPTKSGYGNNFTAGHIPSNKAAKTLVESIIIKCIFKPFIMRMVLVQKELKVQENMSLYCEIRQFISYVRDNHGGIFRNTALSGLIESTKFIMQNEKAQSVYSRTMRETTIITTSASQSNMSPFAFGDVNEKLLSKKLSALTPKTRHTTPPGNRGAELVDWPPTCSTTEAGRSGPRSNSPVPDDDSLTSKKGSNRPAFKVAGWFNKTNSGKIDSVPYDLNNIPSDNGNFPNYLVISDSQPDKLARRGSFSRQTIKNYSNQNTMVLSALDQKPRFSKAKKRMDQFKNVFGKNKLKQSSFEETPDLSRKNSLEFERTNVDGHESITIRMSKTVPLQILKDGMLKLQFLLESCTPGTIPDAQLVAAMLDLKAPVIARAAFLIECSHFVHRCNRGQWPAWMRMNFNFFRPTGMGAGASRSSQTVIKNRASTTLQRAAGRTFYQWGELLSTRLEDLLQSDIDFYGATNTTPAIASTSAATNEQTDGRRSKTSVRLTPEEDDFLSVPAALRKDSNCPLALKVIACQLLHEITTFLRETHQYLPSKSSRRSSVAQPSRDRLPSVEATSTTLSTSTIAPVAPTPSRPPINTNRRWSMALSTMPMNTPNAHSLVSLANLSGGGSTGLQAMLDHCSSIHADRRISFVLHEADSENDSSSITSIDDNRERRRLSQVGISNLLLRRSTGSGRDSFKRRSIKLKKPTQDKKGSAAKLRSATLIEDDLFKRSNSLRSNSRRKSGVSERSDTSERFSGEESPGLMSDDGHGGDSPNDTLDASDAEITTNIPWLKITSILNQTLDFQCTHSCSCPGNCYKKVIKSTACLVKEVARIYEKDVPSFMDNDAFSQRLLDKEDAARKEKKLKKILMGHSSPLKRKPSVGHNMDKAVERDNHGHGTVYSSTTALVHNTVDIEMGVFETEDPRAIFSDVLSYRMEVRQEENLTLLYMVNQVKNPFHSIISMMLKSALTLNRDQFEYLLQISWNLVIEDDIQISSAASVAVILCALKVPELVVELMNNELNNASVEVRVNTIHKFYKLWSNRYQCWQRLEDGAQMSLKLPPAAIEFTLPSPRIALECKPVVDPPYMPIVKTKVDEVAINQEPAIQKSFVAATKTRRKQQIELVARALQEQEDKLREERETYRFNGVPLTLQASYEPALFHTVEDHDDNEDDIERIPLHHMQVAQCFFPSCLTTASVQIINLLEDNEVNSEGSAVYEVAYKIVWQCLIEEPALFMRNLLERLTREKKSTIIQTIRRLIRFLPRLPNQAAFTMYNYLTGFIMHHVRTPYEDSQEIIASVMTVIWLIVPNVYGLFLKDLKQILRKEQCDATILITANVPSAKKIIVHGPDASSIPSQFPIHEDTQFSQILTDSLDFFGIDEAKHNEYFLVDTKTNQIHNLNAFVRDFYFFKRSQYPQISLVHMNPTEAFDKFQRQAFTLQFTELGKTLMSLSLIKTSFLGIQRVLFLHEELMKLPSFPRKALETNLTLYSGPMGKEVLGIDTLHKISWVKLVSRMFEVTSGFFAESADIHLFLNVVNGALLLHCEDASILRLCMSTYINAAHQFKNIFATNGYLLIVQPIVQIYANHQTNSLLCRTIEFVFKQFYILHRKPFILQMFGAVAPLLDTDAAHASYGTACQISPRAIFQLLQSLGQYTADPLDILELVEAEKPLKALDFCYQMDSEALTILDSISLCVTVISYASDSERGHQMLTVLDAILPYHLKHMQSLTTKKETPGGPRTELQMIHSISVCMKTLIYNCEALTRNYTGPQKPIDMREASFKNASSQFIEIDEDSHSKYNPDSYYPTQKYNTELDDGELSRMEYRNPRDLLLKIVSEFLTRSTARLSDLSKKIPDLHQKNSSYELLDVKCHLRLAEIAHSLLKLAPYDPQTMACKGLVRYMNEILPNSEWRQEQMRPALIMVLRRLDKTFTKISKKSAIKRNTDWEAARRLLKGVYLTFTKHPYIVHLPHLKSLISVCQNIILGDLALNLSDSSSTFSSWTVALSQAPPPGFTSVAVRLISLQMIQLGDSQSLETLCSGAFSSPEKSEIYLMNMIYPLCVRITSGLKDIPKLRHSDINFILNIILNILKPVSGKPGKGSDSSQVGQQLKQYSLQQIGFLGLKILITCFEKQLTTEWYRISKCIRDLADKPHLIGVTFWNFLDFVSTYRTPLYVLILPYIKRKYLAKTCENEIERTYQIKISEKINGGSLPLNRSKGSLCVSLVMELKSLREDIIRRKNNPNIDERSRSIIQEPNSQATSENRPENSGHRLSFALSQIAASASKLSNISSSNSNTVVNPAQASVNDPVVSSPTTSTKSGLLRGLSFRLGTDSRRLASRGLSVKLASNQADKKMFTRRTSYPDQPESADKENECLKESHATSSEPKLNRRLTVLSKSSRIISPGSLSGETLNETDEVSGLENAKNLSQSKEELQSTKYRLQRQKGQNRRSLRVTRKPPQNRINERGGLFKSETIDNGDDLRQQQQQQQQQSVHNPMIRSCTTENDSNTSSPSYISGGPSLLASPQDRDNDTNGNLHSTIAAIYECSNEKTALLHMNSIDNMSSSNSSSNNQTMAGSNNNNSTSNKLNNNNEFPMRVISNLSLALNTRTSSETSQNNALSPFETTLTTLPFADEDV